MNMIIIDIIITYHPLKQAFAHHSPYAFAVYYVNGRNDVHFLNVKKILKNALSGAAALLGVELGCVEIVLVQ